MPHSTFTKEQSETEFIADLMQQVADFLPLLEQQEMAELLKSLSNWLADDIAWQKVARELNPAEFARERSGKGVPESSLTHSGNIFDQKMTFGEEGHNGKVDRFLFALDRRGDRIAEGKNLVSGCSFNHFHVMRAHLSTGTIFTSEPAGKQV